MAEEAKDRVVIDREAYIERVNNPVRQLLEETIKRVVHALGGFDGPDNTYRLGDSASHCLSDLKKLLRQDDHDDDRTIARIFFETVLLPNDLVPALLVTAGKGQADSPTALKAADLICAMTWPIDVAEELRELDEEDPGARAEYSNLLRAHRTYKAALLRPGVISALLTITIPPLAKNEKQRTPRDVQVVGLFLNTIRNLAFIKDVTVGGEASADEREWSGMQARLIRSLDETHVLELLLTVAANEGGDRMFEQYNVLVLEIFYLLFRGVRPSGLTIDQTKQPTEHLRGLLAAEERNKRDFTRTALSRHSRFGTTISVQLNAKTSPSADDGSLAPPPPSASSAALVLHRQSALSRSAGAVLDVAKKTRNRRLGGSGAEVGLAFAAKDNLGVEARQVLKNLAKEFLTACFNPFLASLLKDIKSERPKITEKDHLRLLVVTKWFMEFFVAARAKEKDLQGLPFGLVAEVTDRGWILWVLRRMREAVNDKPKQWTELQAGIECLTQLLVLIELMSTAPPAEGADNDAEDDLTEGAGVLHRQIIYNGEVLDIAFDSLRGYREGTQSLVYLDASVNLAWAVMRAVEKAGKGESLVRKRKARKKKAKGGDEEDGDIEIQDEEDMKEEITFTFDTYELKFANSDITASLLKYLSRYNEFESEAPMKRVVSLLHRQAVRAQAEGLFFQASTLDLFRSILENQRNLPRHQSSKDLINLVNFVLRKFFKALDQEPFLAVEVFFPMNRNAWKTYSSYVPEEKTKSSRAVEDTRFPPDVQVKKGFSWSEQVGIAVQALVEDGKRELVEWTRSVLSLVYALRQKIIDETDGTDQPDDDIPEGEDALQKARLAEPSAAAMSKMSDYLIPYISDEQADAATRNPQLKLLFRLVKFYVLDEESDEMEWYIPAAIVPRELKQSFTILSQFLETPVELDGRKAAEMLSKKARRRRRVRSPSQSADEGGDSDAPRRKKKEKKQKEKQIYKSAQFIEDSDEEYGDMESFLQKEKELRERMELLAAASGKAATMKATGTKKRKKKGEERTGKKRRRDDRAELQTHDGNGQAATQLEVESDAEDSDQDLFGDSAAKVSSSSSPPTEAAPRPKPRPKPRKKLSVGSSRPQTTFKETSILPAQSLAPPSPSVDEREFQPLVAKRKSRVVISDEE